MFYRADISAKLRNRGASIVAAADISELPETVRGSFHHALVIGLALDREIVAGIANGPTAAYSEEYFRANSLLATLAEYGAERIREHGFEALASIPTAETFDRVTLRTNLPHKTVATRAGIGWIGKNALLITPEYGSAIRITTVLTDADLGPSHPVNTSRCGSCTACVDACPGNAPSGRVWTAKMEREAFFDAHACLRIASGHKERNCFDATICGMCIPVCPWTQRYLRKK